jgi:WD40 repeat protein
VGAVGLVGGAYLTYKKLFDPHTLTYAGLAGMAQMVAWAPNGTRVASPGVNDTVLVWEPLTGATLQICKLEQDSTMTLSLQNIVWSLDGKQLLALVGLNKRGFISGGTFETVQVQVWDTATGQHIRSFSVTQPEQRRASGLISSTISVSTLSEQYLAVVRLNEIDSKQNRFSQVQVIEIWDVATGQMITTIGGKDLNFYLTLQNMLWAPDHRRLATISYGDTETDVWQIWDASTGQKLHSVSIPSAQKAVWSPDGKSIAAGFDVYDVKTGKRRTTYNLDQMAGTPDLVAWSPDGRWIAASIYRTGHFSPFFGTLLTAVSDTYGSNILFILDTSNGRQVAKYDEGEDKPGNLVWSPDGNSLLLVRSDIEVWRIG